MLSRRIACGLVVVAMFIACPRGTDAGMLFYEAFLDGPSEAPPNASPGTGFASLTIDTVLKTMSLSTTFSGLIGTTTVAHIHGPTAVAGAGTAGVATQVPTFVGFPAGVTSGTYSETFDLTLASTYNPAFVTAHGGTVAGAEAALLAAIADGKAYLNIHSTFAPGGEIRGFFSPVPEPTTLTLWLGGAAAMGFAARRRKRSAVHTLA